MKVVTILRDNLSSFDSGQFGKITSMVSLHKIGIIILSYFKCRENQMSQFRLSA